MATYLRYAIASLTGLILLLSGCRPAMLAALPPSGHAPAASAAAGASNPIIGYGDLSVSIRWPARVQRTTQAIPAAANTLYLTIRKRNGALLKDYLFNRPSVTTALQATASLAVHVSTESLVVQVSAYRETIATASQVPQADHIIAQGTQENVVVTLNGTTPVSLQLDPEVTVAGIGGTAALGTPPSTGDIFVGGQPDTRGPAYWTELLNPSHLRYDRFGRYLYFTEDPDSARLSEGTRILRLSMNPSGNALSYGLLALVAGGQTPQNDRDPDSALAADTVLGACGGMVVDNQGRVFLAETETNKIRMISALPGGTIATIAGNGVASYFDASVGVQASFNKPRGLAIRNNTLYVADSGNKVVRTIDISNANFSVSTLAGQGPGVVATSSWVIPASISIPVPQALAFIGSTLYVSAEGGADSGGQVIAIDTQAGRGVTLAGAGTLQPGTGAVYGNYFGSLVSIAATGSTLYVSDLGYNRIWQMAATHSAIASTFAGTGALQSYGDGDLAANGGFDGAKGLLTSGNTFLVCDSGANRVREIFGGILYHVAGQFKGEPGLFDGIDAGMMQAPTLLATSSVPGQYLVFDSGSKRLRTMTFRSFANGTSSWELTTVAGFGTSSRLARGMGQPDKPRQAHLGTIVDMRLAPFGVPSTSLLLLQSDSEYGEGIFRIYGLNNVPALEHNGFLSRNPITGAGVMSLVDNMLSDEGRKGRVFDTPLSLALSSNRLSLSSGGTYHMIMNWLEAREVSFGGVGGYWQGVSKVAGTGPKGFNQEGNPLLIQLSSPRFLHYDAAGNLYFIASNDKGADVLRKITAGANPQISTIAGGGFSEAPALTDPILPIPATQAALGSVNDMDIDSKGNVYLASGTRIYGYDPTAMTIARLYDTVETGRARTFKSIAFDENDSAMYFTYADEAKIKKVYFSRLF